MRRLIRFIKNSRGEERDRMRRVKLLEKRKKIKDTMTASISAEKFEPEKEK